MHAVQMKEDTLKVKHFWQAKSALVLTDIFLDKFIALCLHINYTYYWKLKTSPNQTACVIAYFIVLNILQNFQKLFLNP